MNTFKNTKGAWMSANVAIKSALLSALMFAFVLSPVKVLAQEETEKALDLPLDRVDRTIAAKSVVRDTAIKQRLKGILDSSGKFENIVVEVKDGLVFLEGQSVELKYVAWAGEIAKDIEGVVAVVNNLESLEVDPVGFDLLNSELRNLYQQSIKRAPTVLVGVAVLIIFFIVAKLLSWLATSPINLLSDSPLLRTVMHRMLTIFIFILGFYFFLKIVGLTQFALAVISGTGVIGLVLGFAFRDIAENFISSLLISARRPFHLNDVVEIDGKTGLVRKVTSRGTTLVDFDGNHLQIPNSVVYKGIIKNFSANPSRRGNFVIGIGYDASVTLAQELAMGIMHNHEAVLNDPEPLVIIDNLGSATINLKVYYWIDSHKFSLGKVGSALMRLIMRKFEEQGISMPDDAREMIFPEGISVHLGKGDEQGQAKLVSENRSSLPKPPTNAKNSTKRDEEQEGEDLESDHIDIQKQAENSRDPEEGSNIL